MAKRFPTESPRSTATQAESSRSTATQAKSPRSTATQAKEIQPQQIDPVTSPALIIGTPAYMSPEQADSNHGMIGTHSDVFSLGVVFYEMLTGSRPWGSWTLPSKQRSDLNPRFDAIVHKALSPTPEARYSSAEKLLARLKSVQRVRPTLRNASARTHKPRKLNRSFNCPRPLS